GEVILHAKLLGVRTIFVSSGRPIRGARGVQSSSPFWPLFRTEVRYGTSVRIRKASRERSFGNEAHGRFDLEELMAENIDRRVARTQAALRGALIRLLRRKEYAKIT